MPSYEFERFEAPASMALVTFLNPVTGQSCADVPMLLDTGADISMIPVSATREVNAQAVTDRTYEIAGYDDRTSIVPLVQLRMEWMGYKFNGEFMLIEQEYGIIGRNILNLLRVLFDGPRLNWETQRRA